MRLCAFHPLARDCFVAISSLPDFIQTHYQVAEYKHASAILQTDFPNEWQDLIDVLTGFRLLRSEIATPGGGRSLISKRIDSAFYARGWEERKFHTKVVIDTQELESPTHKVDCFRNCVAVEIEWNNKTEFYDRDLNNFRLLFDLRAVSVGVLITRATELDDIFRDLNRYSSYGASTTHMDKLLTRLEGGSGGGCPVLAFGIRKGLYEDDA